MLPLTKVRILDLTRLLPFASGSQLLADLGAEVIKIEAPGGQYGRQLPTFKMTNRHKRSLTLDLRSPQGQEIFRKLAVGADVIYESFRPGVMQRFGLGYDELAEINPHLVYCSGSGYGQTGPLRDQPGHDLNYAAMAGILSIRQGDPPRIPNIPAVDMAMGITCAAMIMAGLMQARATGRGQHIDVSMSDLALNLNLLYIAQALGAPRIELTGEWPSYAIYETADRKTVALGCIEPKFWQTFLKLIERADLTDYATVRGEKAAWARAEIQQVIGSHPLDYWETLFAGQEVAFTPVLTAGEALDHPHHKARSMVIRDVDGGVQIRMPACFSDLDTRPIQPAPAVGADNESVLIDELGYSSADLERWCQEGIV